MGKDVRIAVRVTVKEKGRIQAKARKCGLSTTEYVKQRALGYEPRAVPPDALLLVLKGWARNSQGTETSRRSVPEHKLRKNEPCYLTGKGGIPW